jgi:hypothetical protein
MPWLSCVEAQVIIERTNAVLRGFAGFYLPTIMPYVPCPLPFVIEQKFTVGFIF